MSAPDQAHTCPNCEQPSQERYCTHCGQDNHIGRLDAKRMAGEFLGNFLGWDSALGLTLKGLARGPGSMVADYVSGRRRRFVHPARFCLLSLALWLLIARIVGVDPLEASGIKITNSSGSNSEVITAIRDFIGSNLEILLFLALPLRAFLMRLFFRRSGRNVAECLVLVLYVAGVSYLFGALLAPFVAAGHTWANPLRSALALGWSYWAALAFFRLGWFSSLWRMLLVAFCHVIGTMILFACVAVPWVLLTRA